MTEQRLKVESGPPQHMIDEPDRAPAENGEAARAEQAKATAQDAAAQARAKAQEAAAPAKEIAGEVAGQAKSQARAAATQAKERASAQVDERTTQIGQQVGGQAESLEGVAAELRKQGNDGPANVAEQAGERVKGVADYLQQADGEQLVEAAAKFARENPAAAAAVGAAAGFAAGRVIKASTPDDAPDETPPAPHASAPSADPVQVPVDPTNPVPGTP